MNSRNIFNLSIPVQSRHASLLRLRVVITVSAVIMLSRTAAAVNQPLLLDRPLTLRWTYPSSAISTVAPLKDADSVYLPLFGGEIVSLRAEDGQLLWRTDVGGDVLLTPTADAESLYIASEVQNADGVPQEPAAYLRSISRSSGVILWFNALPRRVENTCGTHASSMLVATLGDVVIGVDKKTGAVRWSSHLASRIAAPPICSNGLLYLPFSESELLILKAEDGQPLRRYRTQGRFAAFSLGGDGVIYWATAEGGVSALVVIESSLTPIWRKRVSAEIQSMNQTPDGLLVVSRDNSVTYLKRQNGRRLWKRHLPDRLAVPPVVHEGYGLFAPLGDDTCIVLSLRDGRQVNTIHLGANNSVVASPVTVDDYLLVPTKLGLLAFTTSG